MSKPLRGYKPYPVYKDSGLEWLGKIPMGWDVRRLKRLARFVGGGTPAKENLAFWNGDVPWVSPKDMKSAIVTDTEDKITSDAIRLSATNLVPQNSVLLVVRSGILIHKIPVALAGKQVALNQDMKAIITDEQLLRPAYLRYFIEGMQQELLNEWKKEGATVESLEMDLIVNTLTPLPNDDEQQHIANFLDRKTAQIDALIARNEGLFELLKEKRGSLITHAVTKGLDPNVRTKDSGVEWLGEIPVHWELRALTKSIVEKSDYRGKTPAKVVAGVLLVTARNVRMGFIDYECSKEFVAEDEYAEIMRRGAPRIGDILFTTEAPLGNVALVNREDIALAQRIIRFRMNTKQLTAEFALFAMMSDSFQAQLTMLSTGSTAEGIKASKLSMLRVLAPPLSEQQRIVEYIRREATTLDNLIAKVHEVIERMKQLRTALISAAVTGKIDVRKDAP